MKACIQNLSEDFHTCSADWMERKQAALKCVFASTIVKDWNILNEHGIDHQ